MLSPGHNAIAAIAAMKRNRGVVFTVVGEDYPLIFSGRLIPEHQIRHRLSEQDFENFFDSFILPLMVAQDADPDDIPERAEARVHPDGWLVFYKDLPIRLTDGARARSVILIPPGQWAEIVS